MPVLLDDNRSASGLPSAAVTDRARAARRTRQDVIEIGLVNNMPDAALAATERQFRALLTQAAGPLPVRLRLFTLPGIRRGEAGTAHLHRFYTPFEAVWDHELDGLIVTGSEPKAADLRAEPYWDRLADLLDWAEESGVPAILSCLAAHAAVLHRDGIARRPLAEKCSGVFRHETVAPHWLTRGVAAPAPGPHSRWNDIAARDLAACGYQVLTSSAQAGVDLFVCRRRSLLVCFQGHPEYDAHTLLLEYRRDVRRFLTGVRDDYPALPHGYFGAEDRARLLEFRARAQAQRDAALMPAFPAPLATPPLATPPLATPPAPWHAAAATIWRNWLEHIRDRDE